MCLAIYKPKNVMIPKSHLRNGFEDNPDGAGFAVSHAGKIIIRKGFFTFKQFWKHYKLWKHHAAVIHFRWCTHGGVSQANCHPFRVGEDMALVHNGILPVASTETISDTRMFVDGWMQPLASSNDLVNAEAKDMIEEFIGWANKLVLLLPDGNAVIYNEGAGHWKNGIWYSNASYLDSQVNYGFKSGSYGYWYKGTWIPYQSYGKGYNQTGRSYVMGEKEFDNRGYTTCKINGVETKIIQPAGYDDEYGLADEDYNPHNPRIIDDMADAERWKRFDEYQQEREWQEAEDNYLAGAKAALDEYDSLPDGDECTSLIVPDDSGDGDDAIPFEEDDVVNRAWYKGKNFHV